MTSINPDVEIIEDLRGQLCELGKIHHKVAHDLKNPLAAAREYVSLMLDEVAGPITPTQREFLTTTLDCCDSVNAIMNSGLELTDQHTQRSALTTEQKNENRTNQ